MDKEHEVITVNRSTLVSMLTNFTEAHNNALDKDFPDTDVCYYRGYIQALNMVLQLGVAQVQSLPKAFNDQHLHVVKTIF